MRRMLALVLALGALGCGGTPAPSEPKAAPAPAASPSAPRPEAAPDLSPVARPHHVIGIGRASRQSAQDLARWAGGGEASLWEPVGVDLERSLKEQAPIELLVAVEARAAGPVPEVALAVSMGLLSLKSALTLLDARGVRLERTTRGVWRVGVNGRCALAAAVGSAPARLVCVSAPGFLDEILPYATRGLPLEPAREQDDAWLALDVARFRSLHGERLKSLERWAVPFAGPALAAIDPRLDRALAPLLGSIYGELMAVLDDADQLVVSAKRVDDELALSTRVSLGRAPSSTLIATLLDAGKRQAPPPADFWKLPADARFAIYSHGMPEGRARLLRDTLRGAVSRGLSSPAPKQTLELVADALFPEPAFVYATGTLDVLRSYDPALGARIRRNTERSLGWHVIGVEAADTRALGRRLDAGMNDYNRGPLRKLVYAEAPSLCPGLPRITRRAAATGGLPRDAVLYEMIVPGKLFDDCARRSQYGYGIGGAQRGAGAPPSAPLSIAVVFVPAKPRSWIVISPHTRLAVERMRQVLDQAAEPGRAHGLQRPSVFGLSLDQSLLSPGSFESGLRHEPIRLSVATAERAFELDLRLPAGSLER